MLGCADPVYLYIGNGPVNIVGMLVFVSFTSILEANSSNYKQASSISFLNSLSATSYLSNFLL